MWDNSFSELDIEIFRNCIYFEVPFAMIRIKANQHIVNEMKSKNDDLYEAGPCDPGYIALLNEAKIEIEKVSRENFKNEIER